MTSGQAVKYKGSVDCAIQIMKNEGFMSMMKGAGKFCFFTKSSTNSDKNYRFIIIYCKTMLIKLFY